MTYKMDDAPFDDNLIVGVFATREAAESYRDNAVGPVTDGKIVEWGVSGRHRPAWRENRMTDHSDILGTYKGLPVTGTSIVVNRLGDGLSKAVDVEPLVPGVRRGGLHRLPRAQVEGSLRRGARRRRGGGRLRAGADLRSHGRDVHRRRSSPRPASPR